MELKDTIEMMTSLDYKIRFKAEYYQTKIRTKKLGDMLERYKNDELDFKPSCPYDVLYTQYTFMKKYLSTLEERAYIENIEL